MILDIKVFIRIFEDYWTKLVDQQLTYCIHSVLILAMVKYITMRRTMKVENSEKLNFYKKIKSNHESENYLMSIRNISFRKELIKLRISNHNLLIERRRYCSPTVSRKKRLCSICSSDDKLEDE